MRRGIIAAVGCLLLLSQKAFAGWYQVENYEGSIGPNQIHLSLQKYSGFGSGINVEGSYFYDAKQSPVAIYGKADGSRLTLCEIADDKQFERVLVVGSKAPVDTIGCPFSLELAENGATGSWSRGADKFPITLKKVASLDDTGEGKIEGPSRYLFGHRRPSTGLPASTRNPTQASTSASA